MRDGTRDRFFGVPLGAHLFLFDGGIDMKSGIQQLWEGSLCASDGFQSLEKRKLRCADMDVYIKRVTEGMSQDQRNELTRLLRCRDELEQAAVEDAFARGYSTGVRLTAEALLKK